MNVPGATWTNARASSGSLRSTAGGTDSEIPRARIMVAVAWKSSSDNRRRAQDGRARRAQSGRNGGGVRAYGFRSVEGNLSIDEHEAAEIRRWAAAVLAAPDSHAGRSKPELAESDPLTLKALARDLRERGVLTATGGTAWRPETIKQILVHPMNAGISLHRCTCPE